MTKLRQSASKALRGNVLHFSVVLLVVGFAHGIANAAWTQLDLDTVRQAGPMAIYRQVIELTVYATRLESGAMSILRTAEYDCMGARVRVLTEAGFRAPWADGETASIPLAYRRQGDWSDLSADPAGEVVWNLLCPGGAQR